MSSRRFGSWVAFVLSVLSLQTPAFAAPASARKTPRSSGRAAVRRTATPAPPANRAPEWPQEVRLEMKTETKFDENQPGRTVGATTTITVMTPPVDPDGDTLTYRWGGTGVGATTAGLKDFPIEEADLRSDRLTATWWRQNWSGEPASGILVVTADDGKGGVAHHSICVGRYVQCR